MGKTVVLLLVVVLSINVSADTSPDTGVAIDLGGATEIPVRELLAATVQKMPDGSITDDALRKLSTLQSAANRKGSIKIWVGFKMDFQGNPALRTAEVIAEELSQKQALIESLIVPLESAGNVELLDTPQHLVEAPGCLVKIDASGLGELTFTDDIVRLSYSL